MKKFILLAAVMLVGCTAVPVKQSFPEVPSELMESCPDLKETQPTEKLYHSTQVSVFKRHSWY